MILVSIIVKWQSHKAAVITFSDILFIKQISEMHFIHQHFLLFIYLLQDTTAKHCQAALTQLSDFTSLHILIIFHDYLILQNAAQKNCEDINDLLF